MRWLDKKQRNKFHATKVNFEGLLFDSKKEAKRYQELQLLEAAGKIHNLQRQVTFKLRVAGELICSYRADFTYFDIQRGTVVVEDVKGFKTRDYKLKSKLFKALNPKYFFLET